MQARTPALLGRLRSKSAADLLCLCICDCSTIIAGCALPTFPPPGGPQRCSRMKSTVSTKFNIPKLDARLVARPRLLQLFEQGLDRRLTLVAAPAGYGKTTSVVMWLRSLTGEAIEPAWYALDADDNEFTTFFTRFAAALENVVPGSLSSVTTGLDLQAIPHDSYAGMLAEACLQLPHEVVLVLDDYHHISATEIHTVIAHLIQYAADRLHLVLIARHDPPLSIPRLRARQQLAEVRAEDLRLSDAESAALLELSLAAAPSPELVALLQARTEGWAAGLQLAAVSLNQESPGDFLASIRRNESLHVADFLVDEVLNNAPAEVREFMLKTSLVARFNVDLAAVMTGLNAGTCGQILDHLRRANLFLVTLDGTGTWFRYHHQFRAMLVSRAGLLLPAETNTSIRRAAVDWLVGHEWVDEALAECVAGQEWDSAADLVESDRHSVQNRQDWHLLWRRLELLPESVIAQRPGLLLAKAWILQLHNRNGPLMDLVEQAAALLSAGPTRPGPVPVPVLWGEIKTLRAGPFLPDMPLGRKLALIQEALLLLTPAQQYEWVRGYAFVALVHALLAVGEHETAYRTLMREVGDAGLGSARYLARLHQALANIAFYHGSLAELKQTAVRYLQLSIQSGSATGAAWARFGLGWSRYQSGDPSEDVVAALLPIYEQLQAVHLNTALLALPILVTAAAESGREEVAPRLIDDMIRLALARENIMGADEAAAAGAYAALLRHDRPAAAAWAGEFLSSQAPRMAEHADLSQWAPQVFICAKILLAAGATAQVQQVLQPLSLLAASSRRRGFTVEVLQCAVLLACCYWRTAQPAKALHWMQQAVEIGYGRGFRRVYFEPGAAAAEMLYTLVQRSVCPEAAAGLLADYGVLSGARQAAQALGRPPTSLATHLAAGGGIHALSEREEEVLALLAEQLSNKEIAQRLNISAVTVRNHTSSIYAKLEVDSRKRAVARAKALHLLP